MNNYSTGTTASVNSLLTALDTWLVTTVGYTRNMGPTAVGAGFRAHYQITTPNGNVLYPNFRSFRKENGNAVFQGAITLNTHWVLFDGLGFNLSKGYSGAALWDLQSGRCQSGNGTTIQAASVYAPALDNIPSYHFYWLTNPHMIVIVLEWNLGYYSYLIWGEPDPSGAGVFNPNNGYFYGGSTFFYYPFNYRSGTFMPDPDGIYNGLKAPNWDVQFHSVNTSFFRCHNVFFQLDPALHTGLNGWLGPADDTVAYSVTATTSATTPVEGTQPGLNMPHYKPDTGPQRRNPGYDANTTQAFMRRSANINTGNTVLLPHYLFWQKGQNTSSFLGQFPEVFHVYMRDLEPQQILTLGADNYKIFPYSFKPAPFDPDFNVAGRRDGTYGTGMAIKQP